MDLAWGYQFEGESRTVDVHIQKLRKKLDWEDMIKTVYKMGYRLDTKEHGAMRILSEKREALREELKYSLNDVVRMSNPNTWTKIAKAFIRENGLNYGKSINSAEMISFSGNRVEVMCLLDELQGETKKAGVVIDPVTEQVKIFTFIPSIVNQNATLLIPNRDLFV